MAFKFADDGTRRHHLSYSGGLKPDRELSFHTSQGFRRKKAQIVPNTYPKQPLANAAESKKRQPDDRHDNHEDVVE